MRIILVSPQKNEADLLPFFFRYYQQFVDQIIIADNESDDPRVFDLYKKYGATVHTFSTGGKNDSLTKRNIRNELWKTYHEQKSTDWVIVVDADEHIWHKQGLRVFLQRMYDSGITVMKPIAGYDMVSPEFPEDKGQLLTDTIKMGCDSPGYAKLACFQACVDIGYGCGAHPHDTKPTGIVKRQDGDKDYRMFHYAWLGFDYRFKKEVWRAGIRSDDNKKHGWSCSLEIASDKKRSQNWFNKLLTQSTNVVDA
jgi:hypothetical protein